MKQLDIKATLAGGKYGRNQQTSSWERPDCFVLFHSA